MTADVPEPRFLSVLDTARICGVSRNTVFMWVRPNKLYAYKTTGNTNLIRMVNQLLNKPVSPANLHRAVTDMLRIRHAKR